MSDDVISKMLDDLWLSGSIEAASDQREKIIQQFRNMEQRIAMLEDLYYQQKVKIRNLTEPPVSESGRERR